tara:strand:- start:1529 stop:2323 length:795 start_codon:yes stop_codon:yes gene_type:complete
MVGQNSITKIAVVGNTKLTLKGLTALKKLPNVEIKIILGLDRQSVNKKVNSISFASFLSSYSYVDAPSIIRSNEWDLFENACKEKKIDLIILLGDSRIVPESIINSFTVIGNHGAILPDVQGGASLVWGRMLNNTQWGVSIMEIDKKVDSGKILKVKKFSYDINCSELEFTEKCDDLTVDALIEVLNNDYNPIDNAKWQLKIAKHTDSQDVINIFKYCIDNNINIYLPPRTPDDAIVKNKWSDSFKKIFKIANNKPYPRWKDSD